MQVLLKQEILDEAKRLIPETRIERTVASKHDTLVGNIGELVFAEYLYGDWRRNSRTANKGQNDFIGLEVKCSIHKYRDNLHLLVREDYALKRQPAAYVQLLVDLRWDDEITAGTPIIFCGWTDHKTLMQSEPKDFGQASGKTAGYRCYYVPFGKLNPMDGFKEKYIWMLTRKLYRGVG